MPDGVISSPFSLEPERALPVTFGRVASRTPSHSGWRLWASTLAAIGLSGVSPASSLVGLVLGLLLMLPGHFFGATGAGT